MNQNQKNSMINFHRKAEKAYRDSNQPEQAERAKSKRIELMLEKIDEGWWHYGFLSIILMSGKYYVKHFKESGFTFDIAEGNSLDEAIDLADRNVVQG